MTAHFGTLVRLGTVLFVLLASLTIALCDTTNLPLSTVPPPNPPPIPPVATPCNPCPAAQRPWPLVPPSQFTTTINGCTFVLTVRTRTCPTTGCIEYKIEKVSSTPSPCPSVAPEDMANLVMGHLIVTNQIGLSLSNHGASACIVIIRPACWKRTQSNEQPCPVNQQGQAVPPSPFPVSYAENDMQPCTPDECCINHEVVQVTNCDGVNVVSTTSSASPLDYGRLFRVAGRVGTSQAEKDMLEFANREFNEQFTRTGCRTCPPLQPPGEGGGALTSQPAQCYRSCDLQFISEYYRLMERGILRKYGADD